MRLEWKGTIWAPPGPNRKRTLLVAKYSPFWETYANCERRPQLTHLTTPYPMPAVMESVPKGNLTSACWDPNTETQWALSLPSSTATNDIVSSIRANLENTLPNVVGLKKLRFLDDKHPDATVHISFILETDKESCPQDFPFGKNERYSLEIQGKEVTISCCAVFGCFHAIRAVSQLIRDESPTLRCLGHLPVKIMDEPQTRYRGLLIDTGRAFFSLPFLEKIIDGMSFLGLNALHWHLTDDQSFPVEISSYPMLHEKGANWLGKIHGRCQQPVGSFYSQDDLRHIVEFARVRGIRVIPEIDMPAHARSWGRGVSGVVVDCPKWVAARSRAGVKGEYVVNVPLDVTSDEALKVASTVLGEMADIFPDPWFHIGGDEVPMECLQEGTGKPKQKLIGDIVAFEAAVKAHLQTNFNKTSILWDDVSELGGYESDGAIIEVWHGKKVSSYIDKGTSFIDTGDWYLDVGCTTTKKCHTRPKTLSDPLSLGGEACAWELTEGDCESIENNGQRWERNFDKVVWKKLIGFAETLWSNTAVPFDANRSSNAAGQLQKRLGLEAGLITIS